MDRIRFSFCCVLLLTLCFAAAAHSQQFSRLSFQPGKDTIVKSYRFQLHEPDDPARPTLWQGPLSIAHGSSSCNVDASLIRDVFISATGKLAVVVSISGSNTTVGFFDPHTCTRKWPPLTAFSGGVSISRDRLKLRPACEAAGNSYSCSAASVYRLRDDVPPVSLTEESRTLTRQTLGIAFTGKRTLAHVPPSSAPPR